MMFKVGDTVRVVANTRALHFHPIGVIGKVVAVDDYDEGEEPGVILYDVVSEHGEAGYPLSQWVHAADIELIEAIAD
jgi:hypothetical protein